MRHIGLEMIEGRWDKKGTGSIMGEIKLETSMSKDEDSTNCTKFSLFT